MELIDIGLYVAYGLLILATLAAIILPLINSVGNPKSLLKTGIGVVALVVLFFIGYALADGDADQYITLGVSDGVSKFVGGALITMYILFVIAIIGIVITEINKAIK